MVKSLALGGILTLAAIGACSSSGAPSGARTDCGLLVYVGSSLRGSTAAAHAAAECYVAAVHACHAARLVLATHGVDTGDKWVLTVRRVSGRRCVTSVAITSSVLTQTSHRHKVCSSVSAAADGVDLSECKPH